MKSLKNITKKNLNAIKISTNLNQKKREKLEEKAQHDMTNSVTDIDEMSEIMRQAINHSSDDDSNAVLSLTQFPSISLAVLSSLSVCMKASSSSSVCHYFFLPA